MGLLAAGVSALILAQALALLPPWDDARAADSQSTASDREHVTIALDQSRVIKLRASANRVSVANPEIADILALAPDQIYVVGKQLGTTNLVLWDANDRPIGRGILLEVTPDLDLLKTRMHEVLPGERVQVRSAQGTIVVSGTVTSPDKASAAAQLAQSFVGTGDENDEAKKAKVLNLIQVGGSQQVMLEVKVAEISRTLVKRLDVNFTQFLNSSDFKIGTVGSGTSFPDALFTDPVSGKEVRVPVFNESAIVGPAVTELAPGKTVIEDRGLFAQYLSGTYLFNVVIDAAKNQGLAKILAEPNLTTLSGQEAKFLAGGEFPIPVPQDDGNTTIEYKDYGVGLQFVPFVLDSGVISLKVNVGVSELTTQNSVSLSSGATAGGTSFFVPALTKRSANATVEIKTGETIAIAGLINESLRENVDKFPGLGELPVIGMLFRSQEYVKGQTELVIFVTPRLARSFSPDLVKLPTDSFVEPNDTEFYLMGRLEGCRNRDPRNPFACGGLGPDTSGSEGPFGHDL
ncbi:type II and III secretion system protein family protein [Thiocystis violacea]|uniref:type II and III secretion system protein family protein n=1 Tax=Thiocystis violacea TaxID=13725 RepID=UPI001908C005|nr:type II and III secretion system protein family protein [Thiocystis violacea]